MTELLSQAEMTTASCRRQWIAVRHMIQCRQFPNRGRKPRNIQQSGSGGLGHRRAAMKYARREIFDELQCAYIQVNNLHLRPIHHI
jgi:hypothetical protein